MDGEIPEKASHAVMTKRREILHGVRIRPYVCCLFVCSRLVRTWLRRVLPSCC